MPGLVGFVGQPADLSPHKLLDAMASALADGEPYQVDLVPAQDFGLGCVNLGPPSPQLQPVWNKDRSLCLVMTGEIYGRSELQHELWGRDRPLQPDNDASLLLHLFEEFGQDFVRRLNGAFVIAIWDRRAQELTLANDRLGLRPVYYAQPHGRLIFASGLRALLADPALARTVDPVAVAQLLSFDYVLGDRTLLAAARLLPPATVLTFGRGRLTINTYWQLEFRDDCQPHTVDHYLDGLVHHMRQAVARQTNDTLTPGIMLSGGLDSRLIAAFLSERLGAQALDTFTFGLPKCDDARLAQEVAAVLGTRHHFAALEPDYLIHLGAKGVRLTDGMMNCVHMHAYANLTTQARPVDVMFKGFMGDSLLGDHLDLKLWAGYDSETTARLLFDETCTLFDRGQQRELFTDGFQKRIGGAVFESFCTSLAQSQATTLANRQNHFDLCQRQRRFILNGVELVRSQVLTRTPYCDKDLVEFMLAVPPGLRYDRLLVIQIFDRLFPKLAKIPYARTGLPLKACRRDLLIRSRRLIRWHLFRLGLTPSPYPSRQPYADYDTWMRTALRCWVEETLAGKHAIERDYFRPGYIRTLIAEHMAGANHAPKLGMLISLELWHKQFLD